MSRLRPASRRARRALIWAMAIFGLAQLSGGLLLDYGWPQLRFPYAYRKFAALRSSPRPPDIICLGSSRFGAAWVNDIICSGTAPAGKTLSAFNASVPGGDLVSADFLFEHILRQGVKPAIVVIEICPETLNQRNDWLKLHVRRQLRWNDLPRFCGDICRSGQLVRLMSARLTPLYEHRCQVWHLAAIAFQRTFVASREEEQNGVPRSALADAALLPVPERAQATAKIDAAASAAPADLTADQAERTQSGLDGVRRCLRRYQVGGTAAGALELLLRRCRENGVVAILVGVPLTSAHRQQYTPEIEAQFQAYMNWLTRTYRCRFVDYRDRIPDRYFLDNHHLGPEGGPIFSKALSREVLGPAWRDGHPAAN